MIDQFTYPQGDIQTWDESMGENVLHDIPESLKDFFSNCNNEFHLAKWMPSTIQLMQEEAMMLGGLTSANEDYLIPENRAILRIRDKVSGFSFRAKYPLELVLDNMLPEDIELIAAAMARLHLNVQEPDKLFKSITNDDSWNFMVNYPIKEYEAKNVNQINDILSEISRIISPNGQVKRFWLRGQRKEYKAPRSKEVLEKLPYYKVGDDFPSLIPSLGRFALNNPGKVDWGYAFGGPNHWWKKPFLIWIIRQNPQWLKFNPALNEKFNSALVDESDEEFARLLAMMPFDPMIPEEIDDLRQWFFAHYKYSSWIWVLQQYGYLASMLDVTWDVDTALFFSQAQMIDSKFQMPEPTDERIIYVFAEWQQSCAFKDVPNIDWGDSDWARQLPLRVERQRAGCLVGSTWFRQNYYGHLVIAKIRLGKSCVTTRTLHDVFPPENEDLLLKTLLESRPAPEGLYW